jgi:hypothetical protein
VNIQGVQNQASWAQFIRLKQQARFRNEGLASNVQNSSIVKKTPKNGAWPVSAQKMLKNMAAADGQKKAVVKISGGLFDAYA